MIDSILNAITDSSLHTIIRSSSWGWPVLEMLHFIGLCVLFGGILVVDLRLMGFLRIFSFRSIYRLINLAIFGFVLNLITGALFFIGDPLRYYPNPAFRWKMFFVLLAGLNLILFERKVKAEARNLNSGDDTPQLAKFAGAVSILLWMGVVTGGRMIPFFGY